MGFLCERTGEESVNVPVPHVMKEFLEEVMERRKKDRGFVGQRKLASKTEDGQIFFSEEEEQVLAFERRVGIDRALFFFLKFGTLIPHKLCT